MRRGAGGGGGGRWGVAVSENSEILHFALSKMVVRSLDGFAQQYTHVSIRLGKPDRLVSILLIFVTAQGR